MPAIQGTGTADEMALEERAALALEGCVIADVAVVRPSRPPSQQRQAPTSDASAAPEDEPEQEEVRFKSTVMLEGPAGPGIASYCMQGSPGVPHTDHMGASPEGEPSPCDVTLICCGRTRPSSGSELECE